MTQLVFGSTHEICHDITSCLANYNKKYIEAFLVEYVTQNNVTAMLNEAYPEFAFKYETFRRESDHVLAPLVDAAKFDASSCLCQIVSFLDIPVPDTATISMDFPSRTRDVVQHLIHLLTSSESTDRCLKYLLEECNPRMVALAISEYTNMVLGEFPTNEDTTELHNLRLESSGRDGVDLISQLAAFHCNNPVLKFLTEFRHSAALSSETHLVAMLKIHQNPDCVLLDDDIYPTRKELLWIMKHLSPTAMIKCLDRSNVHISLDTLARSFYVLLKANELNPYMVSTLLARGMTCAEAHLRAAALNGNVTILAIMVTYCRKWNPSRIVTAVLESEMLEGFKLRTVRWIIQYLQNRKLPCKIEGDETKASSYKVLVGNITHTGNIERSCKY